jgi:hypothetical protein
VWNPDTGVLVRELKGHAHWVNTMALSTDYALRSGACDIDGRALAALRDRDMTAPSSASSTPPTTKRRRMGADDATRRHERFRRGESCPSRRAAWWRARATTRCVAPGERMVTGSDDFTMLLWHPHTAKKAVARLIGHQQLVNDVRFTPDGMTIASASFDKSIRLWHGVTGKFIATLRGHVQSVFQLAWAPDGRMLVSASRDSTVKVWQLATYYKKGDPYEVYKKKEKLGEGGGGVVYEVQHKKDKTNWALKELGKDSYDLYLLEREILIMKDLSHPGLIGMKEAFMGDKVIYLVLELVAAASCSIASSRTSSSARRTAPMSPSSSSRRSSYMHDRGCAHRDIKAENVLSCRPTRTTTTSSSPTLASPTRSARRPSSSRASAPPTTWRPRCSSRCATRLASTSGVSVCSRTSCSAATRRSTARPRTSASTRFSRASTTLRTRSGTESKGLETAHASAASKSETDENAHRRDLHFLALVCRSGRLFELDGRNTGPIDHGECSQSQFIDRSCAVIAELMQMSTALYFSTMALVRNDADNDAAVQQLMEMGICESRDHAVAVLASCNNDVEAALRTLLGD